MPFHVGGPSVFTVQDEKFQKDYKKNNSVAREKFGSTHLYKEGLNNTEIIDQLSLNY